jgi:hypothetical protein
MRTPDFDELVGPEVVGEERARIRRAHDLLVAAGPPPEMPARLASPPVVASRRRRFAALALAAAVATGVFAAGWLSRGGDDAFAVRRTVSMQATNHAPGAWALIKLGNPDANGNWEMLVTVDGLRPLPEEGYYELLLTVDGEPVATCGSFKVDPDGETTVRLGASYQLRRFDGWVVRPYIHGRDKLNETVVLRTQRT